MGQSLDILSSKPGSKPDFSTFTMNRYESITIYKTSYYSFALPIRAAMLLTGITDPLVHQEAEEILLKMGHFFQVQDDFLDCFGDPEKTGKVGTDIEEGKCCWPFVKALELANIEERKTLEDNYGLKDEKAVAQVKKIYNKLDLVGEYEKYEKETFEELKKCIEKTSKSTKLPPKIFLYLLGSIFKRQS